MDDNYYVQKTLAGETAAYAFLVNKHSSMAFTLANKIVRNREDAEEIAQDAFIKAFQSLKSFKGNSKFSTWLYRIVYNEAISHTRRKQYEFTELEEQTICDLTEDAIVEDLEALHSDLQIKLVNQAIENLPKEESAIVTLFYLEENSIHDISLITGISQANVKVKLFRIRKKLYNDLQMLINKEL